MSEASKREFGKKMAAIWDDKLHEAQSEYARVKRELESAYRSIHNGFSSGNFDFTVLRQRAAHFVEGTPLPEHLKD